MYNTLSLSQKSSVDDALHKFKSYKFLINNSSMGSGKTKSSLSIFQQGSYDYLFILCPANTISVWKNEKIHIDNIISYESFRSIKGHQPKHDVLIRVNDKFQITEYFNNIISTHKCLIILDEFQHITNENDTQQAFKILYNTLISKNSHILALSGTPFDKHEHIINFMKLINIISHDELFVYNKKRNFLELKGITDVINFSKNINDTLTTNILASNRLTSKNIEEICYLLWIHVIQQEITIYIEPPILNIPIYCYNKYYETSLNLNNLDLNNLSLLLQSAQISKIDNIVFDTIHILTTIPNSKVCIYFDYDKPIKICYNKLLLYNPIIINGKININKRQNYINSFQEYNLNTRLLIFNSAVGSESINLDDTHGNFPRYVFSCPNHYIKRSHQMTRRFYRFNTKSSPHIYFVYNKESQNETSILNNLAKKSIIMKETLKNQVLFGMRFPIDYPSIYTNELSSPNIESFNTLSPNIELSNTSSPNIELPNILSPNIESSNTSSLSQYKKHNLVTNSNQKLIFKKFNF